MPGDVTELPALEVLAAQLAALQGEVAALGATNAHLAEELAAVRAAPTPPTATPSPGAPHPGARRFPLARRRADSHGAATVAAARSSRRGMLGTAAKVAAATVAAGVLVEQVGTRAAYADNLGNFSSSVIGTPAVSAIGANGADGIDVNTDTGIAVSTYSYLGGDGVISAVGGLNNFAVHGNNFNSNVGSIAVWGSSGTVNGYIGDGIGVKGTTGGGDGVLGITYGSQYVSGGYGVHGINASNVSGNVAVLGHSADGIGSGLGPGIGVQGETAGGVGVYGTATTGIGVRAASDTGFGVSASSNSAAAIYATGGGDGVVGDTVNASTYGIRGINESNTSGSVAVLGHSDDGSGNLGPGIGVQGETAGGQGVRGTATTGVGVYGSTAGGGSTQAMYAVGTRGSTGLRATSDTGNGLVALSTSGTGLNVQSSTGSAVVATSNGVGYGLYLTAPSGWAIGCVGRMRVIGAAVGSVTLAHGTTSKQVVSTACSGASQVILTATSDPQVRIWAVAAPGAFTIHASSAPSADVTFSYFLIN